MKLNPKQLAVSAALLGLLASAAALPASAAGVNLTPAAFTLPKLSFPWSSVTTESIDPGDYDAAPTVGTAQRLSPVTTPENAASKNGLTYVSDNPNVVSVDSDGVAQAVGLGTANITATCGGVSCTYTITTQPDASMIATEMDITLAASTIAVGDTTSISLAVLPSTAASYLSVSLSTSDPAVATVNNFGKVTGVGPGKAAITATSDNGITCSATVTVVDPNAASSSETAEPTQSLSLNTNYVVLKPGASKTVTGKVSPSSASQKLTFTSQNKNVATVSSSGVITGVATGATSVIVSNGTISSSVTVIVNRTATLAGDGSGTGGDGTGETVTPGAVAAQIENAAGEEVSLPQNEVPTITSEILNTLRKTGRSLIVLGGDYTLRIDGSEIRSTQGEFSTQLTFTPDEYGLTFRLGDDSPLPCGVEITLTGDNAAYSRLYLKNKATEKWQFLNSYKDGVITADTAGSYLLTNQNLRFTNINWTFFIAAGGLTVVCLIAYIAVKKRYWFW